MGVVLLESLWYREIDGNDLQDHSKDVSKVGAIFCDPDCFIEISSCKLLFDLTDFCLIQLIFNQVEYNGGLNDLLLLCF